MIHHRLFYNLRCVMNYITRELERKFLKLNDFFKVILVTGARQVGKTTMLKHLAESGRSYVTMDNAMARDLAKTDPVLFFQTYKPPVLIDEVQKAPELFEQIKIICDESEEKGLIWLTGSQQYGMMKKVRETLAGRIGILELYSLSAREKAGLAVRRRSGLFVGCIAGKTAKTPKERCRFRYSSTSGKAVCRRSRVWTMNSDRSILIPTLTLT